MPDLLSISTWRTLVGKMGRQLSWVLILVIGLPLVIGFGLNQYSGHAIQNAANRDAVVAKVNGDPITNTMFAGQFAQLVRGGGAEAGENFALAQGATMEQLITATALMQEAQRRNIRASEADIDKAIAQERSQVLKKDATDSEWDNYLLQMRGMSGSDYREEVAKRMLLPALLQDIQDKIKVSDADARNKYAEVKFAVVVIPTAGGLTPPQKGVKPLTDDEARKKADDLLAKAKGGADISVIAKENSADFSAKKGGVVDFKPEFQGMQGAPPAFGNLFYGKDFDEAIHKAQNGQLTDVVKVTGFSSGYAFAKVLDRRTNLPKDFDIKKEIDSVKQERAQKEFTTLSQSLGAKAKVEISDADKKAYYDYFKLRRMEQQQQMGMMGQTSETPAPAPADVEKQRTLVSGEFEAMLKRRPDDATAATLVASDIKKKMATATPDQKTQMQDRLIQLYTTILQSTENRNLRFELADLYRDKKQDDQALKQYTSIKRAAEDSPPYDVNSMKEARGVYQQLVGGFKSINQPALATESETKIKDLDKQIQDETLKQAVKQAADKKAADEQAAAAAKQKALQTPQSVTVPSGGNSKVEKTITLPGRNDASPSNGGTTLPTPESASPKPGAGSAGTPAPKSGTAVPDSGKKP